MDQDETGFAPRNELKAALDKLICKDSAVRIMSEVIAAMDQMIMEREEFEDHVTDWLSSKCTRKSTLSVIVGIDRRNQARHIALAMLLALVAAGLHQRAPLEGTGQSNLV